ncbi:MAG: hypothetical protein PHU25_17570 [Deltaproteobacteria bacterium]|nr:hypothetical protein [Deltaproteobacteria bacterium]
MGGTGDRDDTGADTGTIPDSETLVDAGTDPGGDAGGDEYGTPIYAVDIR